MEIHLTLITGRPDLIYISRSEDGKLNDCHGRISQPIGFYSLYRLDHSRVLVNAFANSIFDIIFYVEYFVNYQVPYIAKFLYRFIRKNSINNNLFNQPDHCIKINHLVYCKCKNNFILHSCIYDFLYSNDQLCELIHNVQIFPL